VDGTGAGSFVADVAVVAEQIVEVRPGLREKAGEVIDAAGMIVTPGFIDIHTHYDGQVTWDSRLDPSFSHGVTTILIGNCGVGLAPVGKDHHESLLSCMAGVEDIPYATLREGVPFSWESFPGYLDDLEGRRWSCDVAALIPHAPLRAFVMGIRGVRNEPATEADVDKMSKAVREAIEAGAFGFSTGRVTGHQALDGSAVPGTYASTEELRGITDGVHEAAGRTIMFNASGVTSNPRDSNALLELRLCGDLSRRNGVRFMVPIVQNRRQPDLWKHLLELLWEENHDGANLVAQIAGRPFGRLFGFEVNHPFVLRPTYRKLANSSRTRAELIRHLLRPKVRSAILSEADDPGACAEVSLEAQGSVEQIMMNLDNLYRLGTDLDYEPPPEASVNAVAQRAGRSPMDVIYEVCTEERGSGLLLLPLFNYATFDCGPLYEQMSAPQTVVGLADGGAHCTTICDASQPTWMLTHWIRDRTRGPRLPLEVIVKRLTSEPAEVLGLSDRGMVAPGKRADLNVINMAHLSLLPPHCVDDLPAGGRRFLQGSRGYIATVVRGTVTRRGDRPTGALPGRLVRA
jgi:N-acyl-D-aspartate/D-glutamate deacylase